MSEREVAEQKALIEKTRNDPSKDEHDVKKQEEVLEERTSDIPREQDRLLKFFEELELQYDECAGDDNVTGSDQYEKAGKALADARTILIACGKLEEQAAAAADDDDDDEEV